MRGTASLGGDGKSPNTAAKDTGNPSVILEGPVLPRGCLEEAKMNSGRSVCSPPVRVHYRLTQLSAGNTCSPGHQAPFAPGLPHNLLCSFQGSSAPLSLGSKRWGLSQHTPTLPAHPSHGNQNPAPSSTAPGRTSQPAVRTSSHPSLSDRQPFPIEGSGAPPRLCPQEATPPQVAKGVP